MMPSSHLPLPLVVAREDFHITETESVCPFEPDLGKVSRNNMEVTGLSYQSILIIFTFQGRNYLYLSGSASLLIASFQKLMFTLSC